jgi:hypothetical protein
MVPWESTICKDSVLIRYNRIGQCKFSRTAITIVVRMKVIARRKLTNKFDREGSGPGDTNFPAREALEVSKTELLPEVVTDATTGPRRVGCQNCQRCTSEVAE